MWRTRSSADGKLWPDFSGTEIFRAGWCFTLIEHGKCLLDGRRTPVPSPGRRAESFRHPGHRGSYRRLFRVPNPPRAVPCRRSPSLTGSRFSSSFCARSSGLVSRRGLRREPRHERDPRTGSDGCSSEAVGRSSVPHTSRNLARPFGDTLLFLRQSRAGRGGAPDFPMRPSGV